jgi:Leucine-rich repeat (LRR) protein
VPSAVRSDDVRFQVVSKKLFQNMKLKSLSLRNLGLRTIEVDAFDKDCCQQYLESLDLTGNYLRRLDEKLLSNLNALERLVLANNQLAFGERNFQANKRLRHVDLSGNSLQYLTPNLFYGLNRLESIELSRNNLHSIEACVFDIIDSNSVAARYNPPTIYLNENPIECDCDLFYLNRHRNYKLNLTCSTPEF